MNNDEWGEGGGVGTEGRGGSAGPSSSVCTLVVRVHARRSCARSRHAVRGRSLCVGGAASLSKGRALSSMGGGRWLWAGSCS